MALVIQDTSCVNLVQTSGGGCSWWALRWQRIILSFLTGEEGCGVEGCGWDPTAVSGESVLVQRRWEAWWGGRVPRADQLYLLMSSIC